MVVVSIHVKGKLFGQARIWNNQRGSKAFASYGVEMETFYVDRTYNHAARVVGFPKDPGSPWTLLYMAIKDANRQLRALPHQNSEPCKIIIELWPKGFEENSRVMGVMEIQSVEQGEKDHGDFDIFMQTFHQGKIYERNAKLTDFDLSHTNVWVLVSEAIK